MASKWVRAGGTAVVTVGTLLALASPAAADVVSPPGACTGSGTWQSTGKTETSGAHKTSDVITIPRKDAVRWAGSEHGAALGSTGPRRDIEGKVELALPIGNATIDSWDGSSVRYANTGVHTYDFPSVLGGLKVKMSGFEKDNGNVVCSGSVYVKFDGGGFKNPLAIVSLAGLVIFGGVLLWCGRPVVKKLWAFEDMNPG